MSGHETYRVVGPPGTGKTTYVARQCRHAVERYGSDRVMVCSLTRAAAREAAGRDTGVSEQMIGTLHALAYRSIGRPRVIGPQEIAEWNDEHPNLRMTGAGRALDGDGDGSLIYDDSDEPPPGDELLARLDLARARMIDVRSTGDTPVIGFSELWDDFKRRLGAVDFTDMISTALESIPVAPGNPAVIFVDEAQDLSRLELALVTKWAARCQSLVIVGDPYQTLYDWRGSDPEILSGEIHKVLDQSFRVPEAVREFAVGLLERAGVWDPDLSYRPKEGDDPGTVNRSSVKWAEPDELIDEFLGAAGPGQTSMILAPCDYLLNPVKRAMRDAGVIYNNPYTYRWNPVGPKARGRMLALLALCREDVDPSFAAPGSAGHRITAAEAKLLVETLAAEALSRRGARRAVNELPEDAGIPEVLSALAVSLLPGTVEVLSGGDLRDIAALAHHRYAAGIEYLARAIERNGWDQTMGEPSRVILSTIHGCKGGEADRVLVIPDLSPAGWRSYQRSGEWSGEHAVYRQFYVACTRARSELWLAAPTSRRSFRWD